MRREKNQTIEYKFSNETKTQTNSQKWYKASFDIRGLININYLPLKNGRLLHDDVIVVQHCIKSKMISNTSSDL